MKKPRILTAVALIVIAAFMTFGCVKKLAGMEGKYILDSVTSSGISVTGDELPTYGWDPNNYTIEFTQAGDFSVNLNGEKGEAKYELEGNTLTIKDMAETLEATVNEDKTEVTITANGVVMVFTKQASEED
ncbi:MAG: hypothetical protein LBQ95_06850 [Lachnospiraceae bacterium]|nr:hypothetical protein [Lachnospiraceae bacterium]